MYAIYSSNFIHLIRTAKNIVWIHIRLVIRKVGQIDEVMPRPLRRDIAIYSLEVRAIFSLFVKETHAWFCEDYFCISYGWRFARVCVGTRYPEHAIVRRSVNGGLMLVYFSVTPGVAVSKREN